MISFKLWLEQEDAQQPIVFVDLDETLIKTQFLRDAVTRWAVNSDNVSYDYFTKNPNEFENYQKKMFESLKKLSPILIGSVSDPNNSYVSLLRPHAIDFVKSLKPFRVCALTSGKKDFQQDIINRQNIPFDNVYGREDIKTGNVSKSKIAVLVDDLSPTTSGIQSKMIAMGILQQETNDFDDESNQDVNKIYNHFVQVKAWNGDSNDGELTAKLSEVKEKIANLMAQGV